jgi:hypothetical protein
MRKEEGSSNNNAPTAKKRGRRDATRKLPAATSGTAPATATATAAAAQGAMYIQYKEHRRSKLTTYCLDAVFKKEHYSWCILFGFLANGVRRL